jgi:hypothetical protein
VVVWTYPTTDQNRVMVERSLEGFKRALKRFPGVKLQAVERVNVPLVTGIMALETPLAFPEEEFSRALKKYPTADVVVSFVPPPELTHEQIAALPKPRPKLIVVALSDQPTGAPLPSDLVQVAIVKRVDDSSPPNVSLPKTSMEWFDQYYMVVTTKNAAGKLP